MKGKDHHPRLLYPAKLSFRMGGQIKCFPDKIKLKKFIITKPTLYEMLKGLIYKKDDDHSLNMCSYFVFIHMNMKMFIWTFTVHMNTKMTTNSQLSATEPKKNKNKNKLNKQLEFCS